MATITSNIEIKEKMIINRILGKSKILYFGSIPKGTKMEIKIIEIPKEVST